VPIKSDKQCNMAEKEMMEKLGRALAGMGAKPEFTGPQLEQWVKEMGTQLSEGKSETKLSLVQPPRVPVFSGDKSDVSFLLWKNEVLFLKQTETEHMVLQAVRRSVKGTAAEVLLHLGGNASLEQVLTKFEVLFEDVLTAEQLLEAFYSAKQTPKESVAAWGCRLEELVDKAKRKEAISAPAAEGMLRTKFWSGLVSANVKMALRHHFDSKADYNSLLSQARAAEAEFMSFNARVQSQQVQMEQKLDAILEKLTDLETRIGAVEENQNAANRRGLTCFRCGEAGHVKARCPWQPRKDEEVGQREIQLMCSSMIAAGENFATPSVASFDMNLMKQEQRADEVLAIIVESLERGSRPSKEQGKQHSKELSKLVRQWDKLVLQSGVLYRKALVKGQLILQLVMPRARRQELLEALHNQMGHPGRNRTAKLVNARAYWPG